MDWIKVLELAAGVVAGGLITVATSWFFAWKAEKDLEKRFGATMAAIEASAKAMPGQAADAVVNRNLVNAVLALSPVLTRAILARVEKTKAANPAGDPKT